MRFSIVRHVFRFSLRHYFVWVAAVAFFLAALDFTDAGDFRWFSVGAGRVRLTCLYHARRNYWETVFWSDIGAGDIIFGARLDRGSVHWRLFSNALRR